MSTGGGGLARAELEETLTFLAPMMPALAADGPVPPVPAPGQAGRRCRSGVQAGDRFRGGGEGGIAGCRVPAPAGLDELDLVRVQAAHGRHGQLDRHGDGLVEMDVKSAGQDLPGTRKLIMAHSAWLEVRRASALGRPGGGEVVPVGQGVGVVRARTRW
jgi:hypothetical protein